MLIGAGIYEVAGWSFTSYELLDSLRVPEGDPMRRVVEIENPMSEVHSILRPTLLGSLLDVAAHNRDRGAEDLAIFEAGTVYRKGDGPLASEHQALGVLLRGRATPASWNGAQPKPADESCKTYCPRCGAQFTTTEAVCGDCGGMGVVGVGKGNG